MLNIHVTLRDKNICNTTKPTFQHPKVSPYVTLTLRILTDNALILCDTYFTFKESIVVNIILNTYGP